MSDPLRPYGADTLIIPFTWAGRRQASTTRNFAPTTGAEEGWAAQVSNAPTRWRAESAIGPDASTAGVNADPARHGYHIEPAIIIDAPFDVAAIDYDPRTVRLSPEADAVEAEINRVTAEVVAAAQGEFDTVTRQVAAIKLHDRLAKALRDRHIPGVKVENTVSSSGAEPPYGSDDAVRTDVSFQNPRTGQIEAIWDYKVGNATLTQGRAKQLAEHAAGVYGKPELARPITVRMVKIELLPSS